MSAAVFVLYDTATAMTEILKITSSNRIQQGGNNQLHILLHVYRCSPTELFDPIQFGIRTSSIEPIMAKCGLHRVNPKNEAHGCPSVSDDTRNIIY